MHIHGGPFRIVETDGNPVPPDAQWTKDTVNVGPGERYDVLWEAREPGKWLLHCHISHHTTNNNVGGRRRRRSDADPRGRALRQRRASAAMSPPEWLP